MLTVYGKSGCNRCSHITHLFDYKHIEYEYKSIPEHISKSDVEDIFGREIRSVPIIFDGYMEIPVTDFIGDANG